MPAAGWHWSDGESVREWPCQATFLIDGLSLAISAYAHKPISPIQKACGLMNQQPDTARFCNQTNARQRHEVKIKGISRRGCLAAGAALAISGGSIHRLFAEDRETTSQPSDRRGELPPSFPALDPDDVQSVVGASHFNIERVRALVTKRPALARASWDWGFGDWETALGAASHTGQGEIARLLIDHGARPNVFTLAMLGELDAVKAVIKAIPGTERIPGPHGISLLDHARAGHSNNRNTSEHRDKARAVAAYLESLEAADTAEENATLTNEQKQAYVGRYEAEVFASLRFDVAIGRRGQLTLQQMPDGVARNLNSRGEHAFNPSGVDEVRIEFGMGAKHATRLSIHDPDITIVARRI